MQHGRMSMNIDLLVGGDFLLYIFTLRAWSGVHRKQEMNNPGAPQLPTAPCYTP